MRHTLLTLSLATFFVSMIYLGSCKKSSTSPPASKVHLTQGLLVYLPFSGNLADSSGNANPTNANGMTLTYDEHGKANSAVEGSGNGERLLVTNNGSIKFDTAFSFSMNVMIRDQDPKVFAALVNYTDGSALTFETTAHLVNNPILTFATSNNDAPCNTVNQLTTTTNVSQYTPQPESWYNIVSIYHKGTLQMFVNGTLVSTKTGGADTIRICPDAKLIIGGWWQNDPLSVNGKFDEIRLYNRVLNSDEIAKLAEDFQ